VTNGTKVSGFDGSDTGYGTVSRDEAPAGHGEDRLFTSNFILATLANFVNAFSVQMLVATLPVYVVTQGGSNADAGLVTGALALTALLFRPLMGWLADTWRRRPLVLIGTSFYGLASVVYLLAGSIPLLVFGRLVQGFGLGCYTTAANAYIADIAPIRRRAEAVGFFAAALDAGLIIGPVAGFMLVQSLGFHYLFYFTGGLAVVALSVSLLTQERKKPRETVRRSWSPRTDIVSVDALPTAWMALCMGIGFGAINAFISIFARSHGIGNPGFFFMIQAVALLISRTFAGRVADVYGRAVAIVPGILLMAAALAILPLAHSLPHFVISAVLLGIGFGSAQPASMALLIDRVRPEKRGLAMSTYFTGIDVGFIIGTIPMGVVSQHWGFGVMWPVSAACTLLALAGIAAARRRRYDAPDEGKR
jgi:MFS family permease